MLWKLIGCLCILTSSSGLGYFQGIEYRRQIQEMHCLEQLIREIGGEISYIKAPLPEIFLRTARYCRSPYSLWLREMAREMQEKGAVQLGVLWENRTRKILGTLPLDSEEMNELSQVGYQMNHLDIRMQEQTLIWYVTRLEERRGRKEKILYEKQRLSNLLGVSAGLFLVILLM